MGEKQTKPFQLTFNGLLKVDFQGSHVTSDGGLILVRELNERSVSENCILRQSIYSRLAGYEDVNDAVRVSADPTFRLIGSQKIWAKDVGSGLNC